MTKGSVPTISQDEFHHRVLSKSDPVFVFFGADWCDPCDTMMNRLGRIIDDRPIQIVRVDVSGQKQVADRHGIRTIPALVVFGDQDEPMGELLGAVSRKEILEFIDRFVPNEQSG